MSSSRTCEIQKLIAHVKDLQCTMPKDLSKACLDSLRQELLDVVSTTDKIRKEQGILKGLHFDSMKVRHSRVVEAHAKTFDWIFATHRLPSTDPRSRITLERWLRFGQGIYWISGKAGSGKSTLMKYLDDSRVTENALLEWAGNAPLIRGIFYFWTAGTEMQKSLEGLLQSLLYDILNECPDLIPVICPDRWSSSRSDAFSSPWRLRELHQSFKTLEAQDLVSARFCFFIDGLDEYNGAQSEVIEAMQVLTTSPKIKLCISSRPWPCFEDAFGEDPNRKLYLHDHTREDIELFARSKLEYCITQATLRNEDRRYQKLISEIVEGAEGVFLWVSLVTRSLCEGISNGDTIALLQTRLRKLPTKLEAFFEHILNSIDQVYQERMARTFQVALQTEESLHLIIYSLLDEEDPDFAIKLPFRKLRDAEIHTRLENMQRRLNGRYKGLLEVSSVSVLSLQSKVEFLHRTLKDFLMTANMQELLRSRTHKSFNAWSLIARGFLAKAKAIDGELTTEMITRISHMASLAENKSGSTDHKMLDRVGHYCPQQLSLKRDDPFLSRAIRSGLVLYVRYRLDRQPSLIRYRNALLMDALCPRFDFSSGKLELAVCLLSRFRARDSITFSPPWGYQKPLFGMVKMLLERGADPNQRYGHSTIWRYFLKAYPFNSGEKEAHVCWRELFHLLLHHGALANEIHVWCESFFSALEYKSSLGSVVCRESVIQTLEILFQNGLNLNRRYEDSTIWFRLMDIGHHMQFSTYEAYDFWMKILKSCLLHGPNLGQVCRGECNWFNVFLGNLNEFRWTPQLQRTLRTFEIFLSYGVDPNMSVDGRTMWELLLQKIGTFRHVDDYSLIPEFLILFLRYRADPYSKGIQLSLRCLNSKQRALVTDVWQKEMKEAEGRNLNCIARG